jgi:uncharacterized membrane protein YhaH (DUF805 family)
MEWYIGVLKKYAVFDGRARRKEYWMFVLFNIIVSIVLGILGALIKFPIFQIVYGLAVLLPGIGVSIRRLHDTNRSGWWLLIAFVPIVGAIILLIFMVTDGTPGDNKYGPNPKGAAA